MRLLPVIAACLILALPTVVPYTPVSTVGYEAASSSLEQRFAGLASSTGKKQKPERLSWEALRKLYPDVFVMRGSGKSKSVALTFDDVPDPRFTPQVLDILAQYKVQATFFVVGSRAKAYPDLVKRMVEEGHVIGNHSYNHALFPSLAIRDFERQILDTEREIAAIVGYQPSFIRPPYGEIIPRQLKWAQEHGYTVVNWDVDSADWKSLSSSVVLQNIDRTLQPGSIVLQHAGGGKGQNLNGTIEALPKLITRLQRDGYQLVTLPTLLHRSAQLPQEASPVVR